MLENNVDSALISASLGHKDPNSIDPYLNNDFKHLKECALSVEIFPLNEEAFAI